MERKIVLVADDNPVDLEGVRYIWAKANLRNKLHWVSDGEQAIAYLSGEGEYSDRILFPIPVLMLLDLKMAKRTGFDVLRWLQARPQFDSLKVVVMSAFDELHLLRTAYQLGAASFLTKPIRTEDLINVIRGLKGLHIESANDGSYIEELRFPQPIVDPRALANHSEPGLTA